MSIFFSRLEALKLISFKKKSHIVLIAGSCLIDEVKVQTRPTVGLKEKSFNIPLVGCPGDIRAPQRMNVTAVCGVTVRLTCLRRPR